MSYILDALRRADSERERGSVPSLHAMPPPPMADERPTRSGFPARALVGVIVALVLALAGLLAWLFVGRQPAAPVPGEPMSTAVLASPGQATPSRSPEIAQPVLAPAPTSTAPSLTPTPTPTPTTPTPTPTTPQATEPPSITPPSTPRPSTLQRPTAPSASERSAANPGHAAPARSATSSSIAPPQEADTRVYAVSDLPPQIQRELPKVTVGGAMYSDTPANRLLIINSQLFHEGDQLAPDLVLQEIKLRSAVFQYKGYRYGVNY